MSARDRIVTGVIAGICGGIVMEMFLFAVLTAGGTPFTTVVAVTLGHQAALLGSGVSASSAAPVLGACVHFAVAIGWALGYVSLARTQPQLLARPWISGAAFGLVVYVFMEIVSITAGQYRRPSAFAFALLLSANMAFYGIPVALVAARMLRPATSSGS